MAKETLRAIRYHWNIKQHAMSSCFMSMLFSKKGIPCCLLQMHNLLNSLLSRAKETLDPATLFVRLLQYCQHDSFLQEINLTKKCTTMWKYLPSFIAHVRLAPLNFRKGAYTKLKLFSTLCAWGLNSCLKTDLLWAWEKQRKPFNIQLKIYMSWRD